MSGYITPKSESSPAPKTAAPLSRAAARSLGFALFIIVANLVLNIFSGLVLGPNSSPALAWLLIIVHVVVVLALYALALAFGVIGLRETAGGALRGRGRAIAGIVVSSLLLVISFGATIVEIARAYLG